MKTKFSLCISSLRIPLEAKQLLSCWHFIDGPEETGGKMRVLPPPPPPLPRPHIHSSFPLHFTSGPHPTRVHKAASEGKGLIKIGDDITAGSVSQVIRGAVNL